MGLSETDSRPVTGVDQPGAIIRALRRERGLTLQDVSRKSGLPISTLSKLENGKMNMTYSQVLRMSRGLEVDISQIFSEAERQVAPTAIGRRSITRAGEGATVSTRSYNYIYPATDLVHKALNPMVIDVITRSIEEFGALTKHSGEEFALVLEGTIDFHCEVYAPTRLTVGDSVYFDGAMGHAYIAVSDGTCRILSVCSAHEDHPEPA